MARLLLYACHMKYAWISLALSGLFLAGACQSAVVSGGGGAGASAGAGGSGGGACTVDADCGPKRVCGFPESAACGAVGTCFPAPGAVCDAYSAGCACDGTVINVACTGLPAAYASKPLAHTGACVDGVPDAGACCPATWSLYGCTFPDGGAGFACHNPAMGCASSTTCGEGCDRVVDGRCGG